MRRIRLCLAAALAVAGCATPTVPTDRLKATKSVAVISALGDDIKVEHLGLTVFTNSLTSVRVDWGLDAHMTQRLQGLLASRYEVRQLDYDPVPLLDATKELALFSTSTRINEAIKRTVPRGRADVVVVVVRYYVERQYRLFRGIGFLTIGTFTKPAEAHAHAFYRVIVLDGSSLDEIASADGRTAGGFMTFLGGLPARKIDHRPLAKPFAQMSAKERTPFRATFLDLVDVSAGYTLKEMKLID